jgi:hypothetical protein
MAEWLELAAAPASDPSGITSPFDHARKVTLECPQCRRTKVVDRDPSDHPLATRVVAHCNTCPGEDREQVEYYDADGEELLGPWDEPDA